jgi:hypothetical protein
VPVSILRAAQFHEFPGQYLAKLPGPVVIVPRWLVTIVSVTVAAGRVTRLDLVRAPGWPGKATFRSETPQSFARTCRSFT